VEKQASTVNKTAIAAGPVLGAVGSIISFFLLDNIQVKPYWYF